MSEAITAQAWRSLAKRLGVDEPTLKAVAEVESAGHGFLPSGNPKVLFEGHVFHRLTQGRYGADHPDLSYAKWTRAHYARTGAGEWARLLRACGLDRDAANQSASWGAFQIMGFNYGLCGFAGIEAFVAAHRAGIEEQLEAFAQFIARDAFLKHLRAHDWAPFAAHYNGPAYAKNKYDTKLAAAYARHAAALPAGAAGARGRRRRVAKPGKKRPSAAAMPPGRPEFASTPVGRARPALQRTVKADPVDLRDWLYRPTIARAPEAEQWPNDPRPTTNQHDTSACTGFSLALVIEYLLDKAKRPVEPISGYMLYSMARRYDEWKGNDRDDEGSSLRGALKGWARHGASAGRLWTDYDPPKATNDAGEDWWLDSVKRPLGAYYRLTLKSLTDIQVALMESGAVYASALTHAGWDELFVDEARPAPTASADIPVIECRPGEPDGGHAFAIVGYTERGFVVQNSWGPEWGRGGFGILTYADWRQNAMDAWVMQLGVVTREHREIARASSLRVVKAAGSSRVVMSSSATLAAHEISPFVIDMQNEGRLSDRGQFRTFDSDLTFMLDHHLRHAAGTVWDLKKGDPVDVAIYAHGGLVDEDAAAASARQWVPLLYSNRIFPIFLMWETDALSTVLNSIADAIKGDDPRVGAGWLDRVVDRLGDWRDQRIEGLARKPGGLLWRQMKDNARDISSTRHSGVVKLFREFKRLQPKLPKVRLHLIGHSAGAIVHTWLGAQALKNGFDVATISLLAPAVRVDQFTTVLGHEIARRKIPTLVAYLSDAAEQADPTCQPYGRSLLYLVSRSFEDHVDTPLLGMERHLVPALVEHAWGAHIARLESPGGAYAVTGALTSASSHGGVDDDVAVQDAVIRHVRHIAPTTPVLRPAQGPRSDTEAEAPAPPNPETAESEVATAVIDLAARARRPAPATPRPGRRR
jgi:hypothetical protein